MWWVTYRVLELWVPHKVNCLVYLHYISRPKPPCGGSCTQYRVLQLWIPWSELPCLHIISRPKPPSGGSHTGYYSCGPHEVNCPVYLPIISRPKPPCGGSHTADYSCGSHEVNCLAVYLQIMAYIYTDAVQAKSCSKRSSCNFHEYIK